MTKLNGVSFHDMIAKDWTAGYQRASFRKRLDVFDELLRLSVKPGQRWLDLGCGSGVLTRRLVDLGARVVAVDGSAAMLNHAKEANADASEAVLEFVESDVQNLSWAASESFDGVLCSSVVEYLNDPSLAFGEASRVLRRGGAFIFSIPPTGSAVRLTQKIGRALARLVGRDLFAYLAVSKYEMHPTVIPTIMAEHNFMLASVTEFDPLLPREMLRFLRPTLLIAEATKSIDDHSRSSA